MSVRTFPELPGYKIIKHLGKGAHATIHLAVQPETGREVAVKRVIRRGPDDDRFIAQAENEYEVASSLDHPHLRRCFDLVRCRRWLKTTKLFLIMEYADGDTLEHHPPDNIEQIPAIFKKVAEGLHAMHLGGYAHTDVKPNNIILAAGDQVKIIDFGHAFTLGRSKQRVQGTPEYMAPEQVRREVIDQRTDVFNLGATLYWVVTRRSFVTLMPSQMGSDKLVDLKSERQNQPPHTLNPKVSIPLSKLIMRCCETEPADRPRDMREVISSLAMVEHLLKKNAADGQSNFA